MEQINGTMGLIILLLRMCFFFFLENDICFSKISEYSVAATDEAAFVIGGNGNTNTSEEIPIDVIAQFKNNEWSLFGKLRKRRRFHASITFGQQTMIIGGKTNDGS